MHMSFFSFFGFGQRRSRKLRPVGHPAPGRPRRTLPLQVEALEDRCTPSGSGMTPFIGTSSLTLTETGQGTSSANGDNGNLTVSTTNLASADVTVAYNYLPFSSLSGYVYFDTGKNGPSTDGYNDGNLQNYE